MAQVHQWGVFQTQFQGVADYDNPFLDAAVRVRFSGPSGKDQSVDAFWDGGGTWRVRFSPDEAGTWRWQSQCSSPADAGLHGQAGSFRCTPYDGDNPLYRRGPVRLSDDRRHLAHADGTPFFYLADTAWNGVLRAAAQDWDRYLTVRRRQGFTAVQFVTTHWRGLSRDAAGETAFPHSPPLRLNPAFFQRLEAKVAAINAHGLLAAPVVLWALLKEDPGNALAVEDAIRVARYITARWGAYSVLWLLGGDCRYHELGPERWRRIGRAVFARGRRRLVTIHPCGQTWVGEDFRGEPWFDFIGYQSGHGDSEQHLRWLTEGPPARQWADEPPRPVINLEPNYEAHPAYQSKRPFTDREVRRAAYWSLLVSPTAGVTYGHQCIWPWPERPQAPEGHEKLGVVGPWHEGLEAPGAASMTVLRRLLDSLPWWRLRPAQHLLAAQPHPADPQRFVAAAATEDGEMALLYTPAGGQIVLNAAGLALPAAARWLDPRTGQDRPAGTVASAACTLTAPDENDWLLCLGRPGRGT